jgi:hypothetical protein
LIENFSGLIDIRSEGEFRSVIVKAAAENAARRSSGSFRGDAIDKNSLSGIDEAEENDAIILYNLAEEYETVVELLSKKLSEALSIRPLSPLVDVILGQLGVHGGPRDRSSFSPSSPSASFNAATPGLQSAPQVTYDFTALDQLRQTADSVVDYYSSRPDIVKKISDERRRTCQTLIHLVHYWKTFVAVSNEASRSGGIIWESALSHMEDLDILPLKSAGGLLNTSALATPTAYGNSTTGSVPTRFSSSDLSAITSHANTLRTNFPDLVLCHLPDVIVSAEACILVGYLRSKQRYRQDPTSAAPSTPFSYTGIATPMGASTSGVGRVATDLSKKSARLANFLSIIHRWYKIPGDLYKKFLKMDTLMNGGAGVGF